jgi:hypothetical protein
MLETCYCGRTGELEDRKPVIDDDGREALECPRCGHMDHLSWLQDSEGVFEEARRRSGERRVSAA